MQAEGKSKRSLRLCRGAAYLSGSSSSAKCASRGQKQTEFAVLPRRSLSERRFVLREVRKLRAEPNLFGFCRGGVSTAQSKYDFPLSVRGRRRMRRPPVAGRCSPPHGAAAGCRSSGFDRRANLLKSYFSGFRPAGMHFFRRKNRFLLREASRTSDWASPARSGFTTFCHRKVAPKVSAGHLRRDRTEVLTERAQKTALFCTPAPGARTSVRSDSSSGAMRNLRYAARNDNYLLVSCFNRSPACRIALRK